jgi:oxygen-independent coproporphyrinogen-3 oxidase
MNKAVVVSVSEDLLRQFDMSGPQYITYPTADRFVEAFSADDYSQALQLRTGAVMALPVAVTFML